MKNPTLHSLGILIGALGAAAYSCSPPADSGGFGLGASGGTAGTAAKGAGGASGSAGTAGSSTSAGGSIGAGASTSGGSSATGGTSAIDVDASTGTTGGSSTMVDDDAACATGEASATLKTVNMFVMYDRSWSMTECGTSGGTMMAVGGDPRCPDKTMSRWSLTSAALTQFFQDPSAAGLRVALRFFPDDNPVAGCDGYPTTGTTMGGGFMGGFTGGFGGAPGTAGAGNTGRAGSPAGSAGAATNCDATACAQPLVDIAPLTADPAPTDVQEQKLVTAIMNSAPPDVASLNPNPQTPTSAALQGAANWSTTYEMAHADEKTVIVLITDGEPQGCDTSATNISAIAATAETAGIDTYVIGLGGLNSTALDQIAKAGGTTSAYTVSDSTDSTKDLLAKLISIRGQALTCNLDVPMSDNSGKQIDPSFINVDYSSGSTSNDLPLVSSKDACGTDQGWYFDNPTAPTQIILCPTTCTTVSMDSQAKVKINVGCKPHVVTR